MLGLTDFVWRNAIGSPVFFALLILSLIFKHYSTLLLNSFLNYYNNNFYELIFRKLLAFYIYYFFIESLTFMWFATLLM